MGFIPEVDQFGSRRSTVHSPHGMVATSQPLAAQAGLSILRSGGNAFDAAVATAATLNVVEPTSTGIGGDVFALYRTANGELGAMRSCGGAPKAATIKRTQQAIADHQEISVEEASMPTRGPHTVTVPGTVRGWETTLKTLGSYSFAEVLEPAIDYAMNGFPVSEVVASQWQGADDLFTDDNARAAYLIEGREPRVGESIKLPNLGESLSLIAEHGADVVYQGEIGDAIVDEVQSKGGFLTHEDLAAFEPEFIDPVSTTYNGAHVYELPPNNQGLVALEALNIAEELSAHDHPYNSAERVHYFSEAMKFAFHDGHHYITDPSYESIPDLASKSWATKRAASITPTASHDVSFGVPESHGEDGDTVLLSVADSEGNLVSYINSRYLGFGSGIVAGKTGIALQNRGASFSLNPSHPNHLAPGKRPYHTLIPGLVNFESDEWAAFGVMGGYMQPQGHVQVLSNIIDYDMPLQKALDSPRWRYLENGRLGVETRFDDNLLTALTRLDHDVVICPPTQFGGAQIVRVSDSHLSGATEPRKDGTVAGY